MSIQEELTRIRNAKSDLRSWIVGKGVLVPANAKLDTLVDLAKSIHTGGGSEPVLEEKTISANGVYTPGEGVDGFSKVTVNVPQSGGDDPFTVAWGTELPETVVENQFFIVHKPESERFAAIQAVAVGLDGYETPDRGTDWPFESGIWFEKVIDPNFSWADWSSAAEGILTLNWMSIQYHNEDVPLRFSVGNNTTLFVQIWPYLGFQYAIDGEAVAIPVYFGRNGVWTRFVSKICEDLVEWPEGH